MIILVDDVLLLLLTFLHNKCPPIVAIRWWNGRLCFYKEGSGHKDNKMSRHGSLAELKKYLVLNESYQISYVQGALSVPSSWLNVKMVVRRQHLIITWLEWLSIIIGQENWWFDNAKLWVGLRDEREHDKNFLFREIIGFNAALRQITLAVLKGGLLLLPAKWQWMRIEWSDGMGGKLVTGARERVWYATWIVHWDGPSLT